MDGQRSVGNTQGVLNPRRRVQDARSRVLDTRRRVLETHFAPAGEARLAVQPQEPALQLSVECLVFSVEC